VTATTTAAVRPRSRPGLRILKDFQFRKASWVSAGLVGIAIVLTALVTTGDGFAPRVATIDALAGLTIGAFCVDRLLTFIPAWSADDAPAGRKTDLDTLRWGWGALLGAGFVAITGIGAVNALTGGSDVINSRVDRVIAMLAIAGGVTGLARFKNAVNPPKDTNGAQTEMNPPKDTNGAKTEANPSSDTDETGTGADGDGDTQPPPSRGAYVIGLAALLVAAAIAALFHGDKHGIELLGPDKLADGTIAFVVRFGPLVVGAVVVEQLIERSFAASLDGPDKKLLTASAAVVLGVVLARLLDLYLLHNVGFFHTPAAAGGLDTGLAKSTSLERFADVFITGLVIAAGTAPLHDIASALRDSGDS
jgi:hypothetical protein